MYGISAATHTVGDIHQDGFPARFRQAIATFGSVTALAQAIDRSDGALRKWLRGLSEPNVSDLRAISQMTGVSIEWLITGEGESRLGSREVREAPAAYRVGAANPMDGALLENIMAALEGELQERGVQMPPTKRSAMVVTLYGLFRESRTVDREALERLLKLAA